MADLEVVGAHRPRVLRQRDLRVDCHGRHVGSAQQRVDPRLVLVGDQADAEPAAQSLRRIGEVGVPALTPQRFGGGRVGAFVVLRRLQRLRGDRVGQCRQRVGVEHVIAVALQHGHEHPVAALGAFDQHGRDDGHHDAEKALPADAFGHVAEGEGRRRSQRLVVGPQQRVVVLPALLCRQGGAQEVGQVGHRRAPGNGLPIHDRQRTVGALGAEQHVVQPVVAMHQTLCLLRLLSQVAVECSNQAFAHRPVLRRDLVPVAVDETGVKRRDRGLAEWRIAVQPRRLGQRGVAEQRAL